MPRHQKAERTGAMYTNRDEYFEKGGDPGLYADKGSNHYRGGEKLAEGYSRVAHQDAPEPVAFTQSRTSQKGGGMKLGPKEYIYKKVEEKKAEAPKAEAPAPEPEEDMVIKERTPIKHSKEIQEAKERVRNYEDNKLHPVYKPDDATAQTAFAQAESLDLSKYQFNPNS